MLSCFIFEGPFLATKTGAATPYWFGVFSVFFLCFVVDYRNSLVSSLARRLLLFVFEVKAAMLKFTTAHTHEPQGLEFLELSDRCSLKEQTIWKTSEI